MVSHLILGIVCGVTGGVSVVVIIIVCTLCRRRKRVRTRASSIPQYEAVGEYKPSSLTSVATTSHQEFSVSHEKKSVQPRSFSVTSRSSARSDHVIAEDTSSISARSDTSADSFVFEEKFGAIRPDLYPRKDAVYLQQTSEDRYYGRLHVRLKYDFRTSDLVIHLIEAQDLATNEIGGFSDPFVKVLLLPPVDEKQRQSSVKRNTSNPVYDEYFKIPIAFDDLKEKELVMQLYDYDKFSRNDIIGEVRSDMSKLDVSNSLEVWSDVHKQQKPSSSLGDLLLSLSYLPTAERLTVVVLKAKDIRVSGVASSSDPYVRVTLLVEGLKVKRKKTTVIKGNLNPVWNEALPFNVPAETLPKVSLECCLIDNDIIGHGELIGKCVIGPDRQGSESNHWFEMLHNHRKTIAMWHALHK